MELSWDWWNGVDGTMGTQTADAAALRAEFEKAVLREMERDGPDKFERDALVKRFLDRGAGRGRATTKPAQPGLFRRLDLICLGCGWRH